MFLIVANVDISIAFLLNGRKQRIVITRSCTNLMIKAQQDTDTNKSKPPETSTWATLVYSTQSPNLVSNSSYLIFLKSSLELVCEILRVPTFDRVFFILSIRNVDLQIKQKEIFKGKASLLTWQSCHVPRSWTCVISGFI